MPDDSPAFAPSEITLRTVWGAFMVAVLGYPIISHWMHPAAAPSDSVLPSLSDPIELVFVVVAASLIGAGLTLPRMVMSSRRPGVAAGSPASTEERARAATIPMLVRFALYEGIGLLGFVLALLGRPAAKAVPFTLAALVMLLLSYPSRERIANLTGE